MDHFFACLLDPARSTLRLTQPQTLVRPRRSYASGWRVLGDHLLILLLRGTAQVKHPGGLIELSPGDLIWLPGGVSHDLLGRGPRLQHRIRFRLDQGQHPIPAPGYFRILHAAWHLRPLLELFHHDALCPDSGADLRRRCLLALLLSWLERGPQNHDGRTRGGLSPAQRTALEKRLEGWESLGFPDPVALAQSAGLGRDWFARAFLRSYGMSPRRWLANHRLDFAAERLLGGGSARLVATALGWSHYAQFARQFRIRYGAAPDTWRKLRSLGR